MQHRIVLPTLFLLTGLFCSAGPSLAAEPEVLRADHMSRLFSLNRVDGPIAAIGSRDYLDYDFIPRNIRLKAAAALSVASLRPQFDLGLHIGLDSLSPGLSVAADIYDLTATFDGWKMPVLDNSIWMLLRGTDEFDYFRLQGLRAGVAWQWDEHWLARARISHESWSPLKTRVCWSLMGYERDVRRNPSLRGITSEFTSRLELSLQFQDLIDLYGYRSGWRFNLVFSDNLNSSTGDRLDAELAVFLPSPWIALHTRLRLGAAGGVGYPERFTLGGPGSLPAIASNSLSGNRMLLINAELMLHRELTLDESFLQELALVVLFDAGVTDQVDPGSPLLEGLSFDGRPVRASAGGGIGSRNAVWLIGLVRDLRSSGRARLIFRFSPNFQFF